ncbi:MAG: hypothetical protein ACKOWF_13815 [Chloroflexota bacterium]
MYRMTLWVSVAASVYGRAVFGSNKVRVPLVLAGTLIMAAGILARANPAMAGN